MPGSSGEPPKKDLLEKLLKGLEGQPQTGAKNLFLSLGLYLALPSTYYVQTSLSLCSHASMCMYLGSPVYLPIMGIPYIHTCSRLPWQPVVYPPPLPLPAVDEETQLVKALQSKEGFSEVYVVCHMLCCCLLCVCVWSGQCMFELTLLVILM